MSSKSLSNVGAGELQWVGVCLKAGFFGSRGARSNLFRSFFFSTTFEAVGCVIVWWAMSCILLPPPHPHHHCYNWTPLCWLWLQRQILWCALCTVWYAHCKVWHYALRRCAIVQKCICAHCKVLVVWIKTKICAMCTILFVISISKCGIHPFTLEVCNSANCKVYCAAVVLVVGRRQRGHYGEISNA